MNIFLIVLLVVLGVIALILIIALFAKKDYSIRCEIFINAPLPKVFDYVKQLKNQDNFNKWVMADPNMKRDFKGTDGTVGFVYGWNGNSQAGEGELEITALVEGRKVDTEIRFVRPFQSVANASMATEAVADGQTKVTWSNASKMKYPLNIMLPAVEKMLAKDMDTSLNNLKVILER